MLNIIYAIKVGDLSYGNLRVLDVKIGRTKDLKSTLSQYRRSNRMVEVLDLWQPNSSKRISKCERGTHKIAEKYAYQRKREKFIFLQESYKDFSENMNLIFKNIVSDFKRKRGSIKSFTRESKECYTGKKPKTLIFKGNNFSVKTWREVLSIIARELYKREDNFKPALGIKGSKRNYFTKYKDKLKDPQKIEESPYYFESNINAKRTMIIVQNLLSVFNYNENDFEIYYK